MNNEVDRESIGDEFGVWSIDAEDQLQPEDTLDGTGDVLDRGFIAAEQLHGSVAHGVLASEQAREETIDQRVRQEEPDPFTRYREDSDDDGDDDDVDFDDRGYIGRRVGRIIAPDEGLYGDDEAQLIAREGRATSWDSPEEAAMHFVSDEFEEQS